MFESSLKGAVCCEVKTYQYIVAGRTMAEFELLMFEDGSIGTQGEIKKTGGKFSPAKVYSDLNNAVQDMINIIEQKIKDDEWVKQTQKY
jgi:hypothetical protein